MLVNTTRFGNIDVPDDKILDFPNGVIGFKNENNFVILKHKPDSSFFWLQSLSSPDLAFSLLFPFNFVADYTPSLSKEVLNTLKVENAGEVEIYCMVVIPKDVSKMTINLLSPIVVGSKTQTGMQIVLNDSEYSVNHPLANSTSSAEEKAS